MNVDTPLGPARVLRRDPAGAVHGTLVLGHGAGGGIDSPDLAAVIDAAAGAGWRALGVEQPWRVAGERVAPPPPRLDLARPAGLAPARGGGVRARPPGPGGPRPRAP